MSVVKATLDAVKLRLRPVIMTSLVFILGVVPVVLSHGAGAVARQTIRWTVIGNMLSATLLDIFLVPVLYMVIFKIYGKKELRRLEENADLSGFENH